MSCINYFFMDISNFIENEVFDLENIEEFNNIEEDNYDLETELVSSSISEIEYTISESESTINKNRHNQTSLVWNYMSKNTMKIMK